MSAHDQCPSSKKNGKPGKEALARARHQRRATLAAAGQAERPARAWRSLEEIADTPEFREKVEREFPAGASELLEPTSRRTFLQLMGASLALAGVASMPGCRRPNHTIMPYSAKVPEDIIPGKPLFYATSMPLPGGGAEGLLVETHEGRPTKVEGNPLHATNRGKSSVWAQASVLGIYDPDRLMYPTVLVPGDPARRPATWDDFKAWAKDHFASLATSKGEGLAFLVEKKTSPSRDAVRDRVMGRFPKAKWIAYDATDSGSAAEGATMALGAPVREQLSLAEGGQIKAKVIVSLDRDFLDQTDPNNLVHQREWAATRRVMGVNDPMSRLYVVETGVSCTGSCADHRLRLAPSRVTAFALMLAKALATRGAISDSTLASAIGGVQIQPGTDIPQVWVDAVADDLIAEADEHGGKRTRAGETLIVAGAGQPAVVHALVHAMNAALGNFGKTISYLPMSPEQAAPSLKLIKELAGAIDSGAVKTLVCLGTNPVYDAPVDLNFGEKLKRVASVCLSVPSCETAAASTWSLNGAHYLESWGDTMAWDGTIAPIQPMIAPLYDPARSDIELLAIIADPSAAIVPGGEKPATPAAAPAGTQAAAPAAGATPPAAAAPATPAPVTPRVDDGYTIVRDTWRALLAQSGADFEKNWKRALHDGVFPRPAPKATEMKVNSSAVADAVSKLHVSSSPTSKSLEAVFAVGQMYDGRFANCGWLQELPQPGTRVVWDNPALLSPKTATDLGLLPEKWSEKRPDEIYTRKWPRGQKASVTVNGRTLELAVWILPGMADNTVILPLGYGRRTCGRVGDGVGFNTFALRDSATARNTGAVTVVPAPAEYMIASTQNNWSLEGRSSITREVDLVAWRKHGGEPSTPRTDPLYGTPEAPAPISFGERVGGGELSHSPPNVSIYPNPLTGTRTGTPASGAAFATGPQWGMSIDLATCTGCGACTIACQAENNIPIVGKKEVAKNREMHWIRVDRYFAGDLENPEKILHQPVPCMQCENAPCETVCPVNATVHGPEGINYQVYNRCIGTRYCENNCPYKVRRFNFFDYGVVKFNGDYLGQETVEGIVPKQTDGSGGITGSGEYNKINPNLVPPRLRQKLEQIERMQKNPDVTVRSRGVMEKCTYCIQRLNEARIEMKLHELKVMPDGFVQTACQQACPTDAIVFGDRLDAASNGGKGSRVKQLQAHQRSYMLLGFLNTRPRTTYMVRVDNPNPAIRKGIEDPFGHHGGGHGEEHEGAEHASLDRSTFIRNQAKTVADKGYALSLRVLGSIGL
jgi:MoCo/4Fe-4S cofactor protein with predicted Tat translocation signal